MPDDARTADYLRALGWERVPTGSPAPADVLTSVEARAILVAVLIETSDSLEAAAERAAATLADERGEERIGRIVREVQRRGEFRRDASLERGPRFAVIPGARPVVAEVLEEPSRAWFTARGEALLGLRGDHVVRYVGDPEGWTVMPELFAQRYRELEDGTFARVGVVRAVRHEGDVPRALLSPEGPQQAERGDWVLTSDAGDWWVQTDSGFRAAYVEIGD